jgi:hypothetical protein
VVLDEKRDVLFRKKPHEDVGVRHKRSNCGGNSAYPAQPLTEAGFGNNCAGETMGKGIHINRIYLNKSRS